MQGTNDFVQAVKDLDINVETSSRAAPDYEDPVFWGPAGSLESQDALIQQNVHLGLSPSKTAAVRRKLSYMTDEELVKEAAVMAVGKGLYNAGKALTKGLFGAGKATGKGVAATGRAANNVGKRSRGFFRDRRATQAAEQAASRAAGTQTRGQKVMHRGGQAFEIADTPMTAAALTAPAAGYGTHQYNRLGQGGGYG